MASHNSELVTQFTEDAFANEDRICQRPSCASKIRKGEPCFYIATIVHGQSGRFVCGACHRRYQGKVATGVRPTGTAGLPDPQRIRQSVNAGQRLSSMQPPPVVATSHGYTRAGPSVMVPSSWHRNAHVQQPNPSPAYSAALPVGYSVNHALYGIERERWAKQAYSVPPAEIISLEISAVREGGNKRKGGRGIPFGNICEGRKDIDAKMDAPGLITLALETVGPKISAFAAGFLWRQHEFIVRDGGWVDLSTHPANIPYFYSQCLQASRKGTRTTIFKSKQFTLSVVVPMVQWDEYEMWLEKEELSLQPRSGLLTGSLGDGAVAACATSSSNRLPPIPGPSVDTSFGAPLLTAGSSVITPSSGTLFKRPFQRASSSPGLPSSPPHKKTAVALAFRSPNREHLREALQSGGTTDLDVQQVLHLQNETIQFFPIPKRPLTDILKDSEYHAFRLDPKVCHAGQLTVDTSLANMLGAGGFKTAHPGWLTLFSMPEATPETELGSRPRQNVAVKRPFYKAYGPGSSNLNIPKGFVYGRYVVADELPKLFREANVLYWAGSLLQFSYDFIDHCISRSTEPPPFHVPRLRFVNAGLALSYAQTVHATNEKSKPSSPRAGFLIEELIEDSDSSFVKYIHNMDCNPMLDADESGYEIAEFLACTQHIQYVKTGGLAFISDYQGDSQLLTDPQVLTHPSVSEGKDIFGDGNIEVEVSMFKKNHICNDYCKWRGFGLESFPVE